VKFAKGDRVRVVKTPGFTPVYPQYVGSVGHVEKTIPEDEYDSESYLVVFDDGERKLFFADELVAV
jgi:hypothetical protein